MNLGTFFSFKNLNGNPIISGFSRGRALALAVVVVVDVVVVLAMLERVPSSRSSSILFNSEKRLSPVDDTLKRGRRYKLTEIAIVLTRSAHICRAKEEQACGTKAAPQKKKF